MLRDGQFTAIELAREGGCSDRLIGMVVSGERDMAVSTAEKISRYLCAHGETRVAVQFLCPRYTVAQRPSGTADGCIKAELLATVHAVADADSAFGQRDKESLLAAIDAFRSVLADLEAEAAAL